MFLGLLSQIYRDPDRDKKKKGERKKKEKTTEKKKEEKEIRREGDKREK